MRPVLPNICLASLLAMLTLLSACASRMERALTLSTEAGFVPVHFFTQQFELFALLKTRTSPVLHVYIEGDGYAWESRTRPSADPTPKNPIALRLAVADTSPHSIVYLARPCQFGVDHMRAGASRYWTSARFAPEVISSMNQAVDSAKQRTGATRIALIGYSGGGGVAVLLAEQRDDVFFLGTVAGNLDHASWTRHHGISPMHDSLNPVDAAVRLRHLPQRHVSSLGDAVMPPILSVKFCQAVGKPQSCLVVSNIAHDGAWEEIWQSGWILD